MFQILNTSIKSMLVTIILLTSVFALPIDNTDKKINQIDSDDNAHDSVTIDAAKHSNESNNFENFDIIDLSHLDRSILFGQPDLKQTAKAVANYNPITDKKNPEELGSYLEGDILIPPGKLRNGLISETLRWSNGIVPFEIKGDFNAREMANIESGIKDYHSKTCIRFKPRTNEPDYISIVNGNSGCWSSIGRIGGKQEINLQSPGCTAKRGTFIHEVMHALGFLHEQNRHERDSFITVQWNNIQNNVVHNFKKASSSSTYAFGVPYDYGSVMHYSPYAFSNNGQPTIVAKQSANNMGQRDAFSPSDVQKINAMYGCARSPGGYIRPTRKPSSSSTNPFLSFISGLFGGRDDMKNGTDVSNIETNKI